MRINNFIGGEWASTAEYISSVNPSTGGAYLEVPRSGEKEVDAAVRAAKAAFPAWRALRAEERADILDRIADGIDARLSEFAQMESDDQGKPVSLATSLDIPRAALNFRFFAGCIRHELSDAAPIDARTFSYVRREPIGVAGLISPWNLPLYLLTWKIAPALAYGNTCVAKPSEWTSGTAWLLAKVMKEAGLPAGVCNLVFGYGHEAGQALVEHEDVPLISFTGGTVTGRKIAETAAPRLKKLSLELGGKNPTIIFKDALELFSVQELAKNVARSAFLNQGEICLCGSRLYVEEAFYDEFSEALVSEVKALTVGDPRDASSFMGPLVSAEHLAKVSSYIQHAKESGLKILCGGERPKVLASSAGRDLSKGFFISPTIVADVPESSRLQKEEIFGPVVTLSRFKSEDEVIALANNTRYGLSASLWTNSLSRAHGMAARLEAGTVWINGWMIRDLRMPFGGVKDSGLGREGQMDSLHFFTEPKTVCVRFGRMEK